MAETQVEIRIDANNIISQFTTTNDFDEFDFDVLGLEPGTHSVSIRGRQFDTGTSSFLESDWTSFSITQNVPGTSQFTFESISLTNDTGEHGDDFVTWDTRIEGVISPAISQDANVVIEIDTNGDTIPDTTGLVTSTNSWIFHPKNLKVGHHGYSIRIRETNDSGLFLFSPWETLTFEKITEPEPLLDLVSFGLETDDGSDLGLLTQLPILQGQLTGEGLSTVIGVEFDHDADNLADSLAQVNSDGNFAHTLFNLDTGTIPLQI